MAQTARDLNATLVSSPDLQLRVGTNTFAIGAAGAVDPTIAGYRASAGCTLTNTGAGTFTGVFPACPNVAPLPYVAVSAAGTVVDAVCTAYSATAGTIALTTKNAAGAATNPASGDIIGLILFYIPMGQST